MVADAVRDGGFDIPASDLDELMSALASKFKKENGGGEADEAKEARADEADAAEVASGDNGKTGQLVFFPQPFARRIAELTADFRGRNEKAYSAFLGRKLKSKPSSEQERQLKSEVAQFLQEVNAASQTLTVDIAMFGRMTTSDLVVNVEAAAQVAHAITTHEILIESDYFTAMDEEKSRFATTQTERAGAAFLGSGETETFFNSGVFYKYLNLDIDALQRHLPALSPAQLAGVAGTFVKAAALANPTGKQNSFAAHGVPELILVEISRTKSPISYANAFLQAIDGGMGRNLMTESAKAFCTYVDEVGTAFAPSDVQRLFMAVGPANVPLKADHRRTDTLANLADQLAAQVAAPGMAEVPT